MVDSIRATYTTRRRAFDLDEAGAKLGQKNDRDQDFNRSKVHQRDSGDLSIVSTLSRVENGSWGGKSAFLVTFSFSFDSVINFGPKRLLGQKTEEDL